MERDDNLPARGTDLLAALLRQDIDPLSVDELDARIAALQTEIERCAVKKQTAIAHRSEADQLFKS